MFPRCSGAGPPTRCRTPVPRPFGQVIVYRWAHSPTPCLSKNSSPRPPTWAIRWNWGCGRRDIAAARAVAGERMAGTGLALNSQIPGRLLRERWTVTPRLDRIGIRLRGTGPLHRSRRAELPSEGMVPGALQVPPEGHPVLFLADHPVTGGYPVIAVVPDADVDRAAQVRPGQPVRFVAIASPWA